MLACPCCHKRGMDNGFLLLLDSLRDKVGPLIVTSGYRCEDYNDSISATGRHGSHTLGRAADLKCTLSSQRYAIIKAAMDLQILRVGIAKTYIHVDNCDDQNDGFPDNVAWVY